MMYKKKISSLLLLCAFSGFAVAENETLEYDDYLKEIQKSEEKIDYSKSLIKHNELHTLIPKKTQKGNTPKKNGDTGDEINKEKELEEKKVRLKNLIDKASEAKSADNNKSTTETNEISPVTNLDKKETSNNKTPVEQKPNKPSKKGNSTSSKRKNNKQNQSELRSGRSSDGGYIYIPPSLRSGSGSGSIRNGAQTSFPKDGAITFDIKRGSEIKVTLAKSASSIQHGYVKLRVLTSVEGRKQILPAGSILFARTKAVKGSNRLFAQINSGITPDGLEFNMQGSVVAMDGQPGFAGIIQNDGKAMDRAVGEGGKSFSESIVESIPSDSVAAEALKSSASALLGEKNNQVAQENGEEHYIVLASPQDAIVEVEKTF